MLDAVPCKQGMAFKPRCYCRKHDFRARWGTQKLNREDGKMKNYVDGGEAILEAFRKLKINYILS